MKFLSFLNVSNINNIDCDSGYIFQKHLGLSLIEMGHSFTLVIPSIINDNSLDIQYFDFGSNKFQVRFSFDWGKVTELIRKVEPDVIISNQPELTANIKALTIVESFESKLYTYVHYFPFSVNKNDGIVYDSSLNNKDFCQSIIMSFMSGLLSSDKILVHSEYSITLLKKLFSHFNISLNTNRLVIMPPPYDEFLSNYSEVTVKDENILYNHRLYKQYGTEFLLEFIKIMVDNDRHKFVVTDLLFNRSPERVSLDGTVDFYRNKLMSLKNVIYVTNGHNREKYRHLICTSKIALAPYRNNCTWSMSVIDCMSLGAPVMAPNFAWFSEFIPKRLLFNDMPDLVRLTRVLFKDSIFYEEMSLMSKELVLHNNLGRIEIASMLLEIS